jgi:hypothetical protein
MLGQNIEFLLGVMLDEPMGQKRSQNAITPRASQSYELPPGAALLYAGLRSVSDLPPTHSELVVVPQTDQTLRFPELGRLGLGRDIEFVQDPIDHCVEIRVPNLPHSF